MNLFASIIRDIHESKSGRIFRCAGHWMLTPGETRENGSYEIPGTPKTAGYLERYERIGTDKEGRKMRLISKRAVHCPNPEYAGQFASLKENCVCLSVPETFCRKCPLYRTARKSRRRYATCGFKASAKPAEDTAKEFSNLLSAASNKAKQWLE